MVPGRVRRRFFSGIALAASVLFCAADVFGALEGGLEQAALKIITKRCLECHNPTAREGGLELTTLAVALRGGDSGAALVPGDVAGSLLMERVLAGEMPEGNPLPDTERQVLRRWVESGAPWQATLEYVPRQRAGKDWWSLQPLRYAVPPVTSVPAAWASHPVDRFVYAKLEEEGLVPAGLADRRTLIRRLTFDLTGLPPTPRQIQEFLADARPGAYERVVDRLLASPAYGERWGRHWLDVVRFGESHGYEQNHLRSNAWPFRDYVIRSFNDDKPFDRMVAEHLAGDQVAPGDPEVEVGTAFLVAGPHDTVGINNIDGKLQKYANDRDDMIMATSTAFLALTTNCARCHDHKFDPILQKDYYQMRAVFEGVQHTSRRLLTPRASAALEKKKARVETERKTVREQIGALKKQLAPRVEAIRASVTDAFREPVNSRGTTETFASAEAKYVRMDIHRTIGGRPRIDELEVHDADGRNLALASLGARAKASSTRVDNGDPTIYGAALVNDGAFAAAWIASAGSAWIEVELPAPATIAAITWSLDRPGNYSYELRDTAVWYDILLSLDGTSWRKVAHSFDRQPPKDEFVEELLIDRVASDEQKAELERLQGLDAKLGGSLGELGGVGLVYAGKFEEPKKTHLLARGNPMKPLEEVAPASPGMLGAQVPGFELASDGPEGERRLALARWITHDTNPLTPRVLANRLWHYHFGSGLVTTPSDFGFNGSKPSHPQLLDWLAARLQKLGWRLKPLHREIVLSRTYRQSSAYDEANASKDNESRYLWRFPPRRLAAEELRDSLLAVSGTLDRRMGGPGFRLYHYSVDNVATYRPLEEFGPETYRRSVYYHSARSVQGELLAEYDCPDPSLPAPRREMTTSPLQALALFNNVFAVDQSEAFARRIRGERADDETAQVGRVYSLALGRTPDPDELARARQLVREHGLPALCRAVLNLNEFIYVH